MLTMFRDDVTLNGNLLKVSKTSTKRTSICLFLVSLLHTLSKLLLIGTAFCY